MGVNFKLIFILTGLIFILSSCRTSAPRLDYQALARASILLGVDINMEDNHKLYLESAEWIGVPYRGGGDSKRGTDCSGLTYQIYRKVYRTQVPRNTEDLRKESTKVAKRNLREGDLVFFSSSRSRKKVAHVGIYLKNGKFKMCIRDRPCSRLPGDSGNANVRLSGHTGCHPFIAATQPDQRSDRWYACLLYTSRCV